MSQEAALQFLALISRDDQIKAALSSASQSEVLEIAKARGYEMTMQEFKTILTSAIDLHQNRPVNELPDETLESVAGGVPLPVGLVGVALAAIAIHDMGKRHDWWDGLW